MWSLKRFGWGIPPFRESKFPRCCVVAVAKAMVVKCWAVESKEECAGCVNRLLRFGKLVTMC